MRNLHFKRASSFVLMVCILLSLMVTAIGAENQDDTQATGSEEVVSVPNVVTTTSSSSKEIQIGYVRQNNYNNYVEKYKNMPAPIKEIIIPGSSYSKQENAELEVLSTYEGKNDVLLWKNHMGTVEWTINIEEAGLYHMGFDYFPVVDKTNQIEFEFKIDNELPFESTQRTLLDKAWQDKTEIRRDVRGNDIQPLQVQLPTWINASLIDRDGLSNNPYSFYFSKGTHTLSFRMMKGNWAIQNIKFYNNPELPTYEQMLKEYKEKGYKDAKDVLNVIEGETAYKKSASYLYPGYDRTSSKTSPAHPTKMRYNTGSYNWDVTGDTLSWKFEVPQDGLYEIGMRSLKNIIRGLLANRRVYIDGKVPFKELDGVTYKYAEDWYLKVLGDDKPFKIYLTKGVHDISIEVIPGDIADSMRRIEDYILKLNNLYLQIVMITGPRPDPFRDYFIEQSIPTLITEFEALRDALYNEKKIIESIAGRKGSDAVCLERMALMLDSMILEPDTIPTRIDIYKSNVSAISGWALLGKFQPLQLDYLVVKSPEKKFPKANETFFERIVYDIKAFLGSFTENYTAISDDVNGTGIKVWVGLGRDQAQIIKELIDSYFTPQTGISVNLSLVQGSLLEATLAGRGPDVSLFAGIDQPVNIAARGALVDLKQFKDYDQVIKRFNPMATVPYEYKDGCYGLPLQQTFPMLFYRKDILKYLGIERPPETWDELYNILPILQRNNMAVGLTQIANQRVGAGNVNALAVGQSIAVDAGDTFATLMAQRGVPYFKEDGSKTNFDDTRAVEAFSEWTRFYTSYSFYQTYDFFSLFRTGEMPIGIAGYSTYNMLMLAASEIRGLWGMQPIIGTKKEDGTIDRSTNSTGSCLMMFDKIKEKEKGWEFLKWFTSAETQALYAAQMEALQGPLGRFETANVEALSLLPWSAEELELLSEQQSWLKEIPVIPASYDVSRNVVNAFRRVVNDFENPRETMIWYNREINIEIARKREELGID